MLQYAGAALQGEKVTLRQWLGCGLALSGAALIEICRGMSGEDAAVFISSSDGLSGDALLLLTAVIYAMYTVRLGYYSRKVDPTLLSTCKVISAMGLCALWLGVLAVSVTMSPEAGKVSSDLANIFQGLNNPQLWLLLGWLGEIISTLQCVHNSQITREPVS